MRRGTAATVGVWFLRVVLVGIVAAVFVLPPLSTLNQGTDTARITSYDVAMALGADGSLRSVETITVDMPAGKHGIYRIFDTTDERRNGVEHPVSGVSVSRDGNPEPSEWTDSAAGTRTLRIGSASVLLTPGQHVYVITSTTTDALNRTTGDRAQWWWNVVGSGWQMSMDRVTVTATLPAAPERTECVEGDHTPCTASVEERTMRVSTGPLAPHTPVTVRVTFPKGAVPTPPADPSVAGTVIWSIVTGLLGAALGFVFVATTRERRPGFPVLFEPPAGVSPALGARILHETDSADDLQATLYDLGERGVLRLDGDDDAWRINLLVDPTGAPVSEGERTVLADLGLTAAGDSFLVSKTKTAGQKVTTAVASLRASVHAGARPYLRTSPPGVLAKALGWLATAGVLAMAGVYFFTSTGWLVWPLLIGAAAFAVVDLGVMLDPATASKHTAEGQEMWSRTGGFARFLTTDSAESRFDAAAHLDWYPRYLSWALVLGSADAWARRFEAQGVDLPVVPWLYWTGTSRGFTQSSLSDSFNSAIAGASATYAASQSSSGGGGFSGGSGGGGGGGGSW